MDAGIRVQLSEDAPTGWDAYVAAHPSGTAYHRAAAVRIGATAFGLRTTFAAALDACGEIRGALPLVEQSSAMFGRYLVSLPFFTYGGILADNSVALKALAMRAAEHAAERNVDHLELRHSAAAEGLSFPERTDKVSMMLSLPKTEEDLGKRLGSKLRSQIKRADREQPNVAWGGVELLDDFYSVFAPTMHRLGTPVYAKRFFDVVVEALPGLINVLVVRFGRQPKAAAIVVRHGHSLEVPWAATSEDAKRVSLNMRLYWEMLRYAISSGAQAFDFGRSSVDSGTYRFKEQWGAAPVQLHWHYWIKNGRELPKLNHSNPKYALAGRVWSKMPLWCANLLGPKISRYLP